MMNSTVRIHIEQDLSRYLSDEEKAEFEQYKPDEYDTMMDNQLMDN